jgi:DnaJ domain
VNQRPKGLTHYQRLGVAPTATDAEIRAAYRTRARASHPDHAGSTGDMAAVNEAWRVLGDPARRAAYDRALAAGRSFATGAGGKGGPGGHGGPGGDGGRGGVGGRFGDDDDDALAIERPAGRAGYFTGLPWLIVLAVLAVIFVFTAYAAQGGGEVDPRPDGIVQRGDCVLLRTGHPAQETSCEGAHDAVVADVVAPGLQCQAGTEPARGPVGAERICLRPD